MNRTGFLRGVASLSVAVALGRSMDVAKILEAEEPQLVSRAAWSGSEISGAKYARVGDILRFASTGEAVVVTSTDPHVSWVRHGVSRTRRPLPMR